MRVDIIGWEVYDSLLGTVVAEALQLQERKNHPMVPALSLLAVAEKYAVSVTERTLALKYGDLNQAIVGIESGSAFRDATESLGAVGLLTHLAARAIVADAKNKDAWRAYLTKNEHIWRRYP